MSKTSQAAYEAHADAFLLARDASAIGASVVAQWAQTLKPGASVLELACGGGWPITRALMAHGVRLHATDASPTLVEVFRARFPTVPVRCETVQDSTFFNQRFDAVLAVGLIFLLNQSEQIELIRRIPRALNMGGRFMFSAPIQAGSWADLTTGVESVSLGAEEYERALLQAGFRLVARRTDQGAGHYYDAVLDQAAVAIE